MSWQDYVDNQLLASACVSRAAIAGHDGGVWAKSNGFEVSSLISPLFPLPHHGANNADKSNSFAPGLAVDTYNY